MYARCHYVNQAGQLDRQQQWWQDCVWDTGSLSAASVWMVGIRDIHTKGQSGRIREQSCLKRPLFLIKTSRVLLSTFLPLSPTGISECLMMCPSRQTPPASLRRVESGNRCKCVRENWRQTFEIIQRAICTNHLVLLWNYYLKKKSRDV